MQVDSLDFALDEVRTERATVSVDTLVKGRFDDLVSQSYTRVFNLAHRLSGNRSDAEDLTQEAFYRAFKSFDTFEGNKRFENWIFKIVTRLFLDLLRTRRRRVSTLSYDVAIYGESGDESLHYEVPDPGLNPEELLMKDALNDNLHFALATLDQDAKRLIALADLDEMPYRDIARMLDKPLGTIRSRLHRTHRLLRTASQMEREGKTLDPVRRRRKARP